MSGRHLWVCAVLLGWSAVAGARPKIAVLEITPVDQESEKASRILGETILTQLSKTGRFDVIGQSDIASMLGAERQRQLLGCSDDATSCLAELGGALGADYFLVGTVSKLEREFRLDLKLMDPGRSRVVAREGATASSTSALLSEAEEMVERLIAVIPKKPRAGGDPVVEATASRGGTSKLPPILLLSGGVVAAGAGAGLTFSALGFNARKSSLTIDEASVQRTSAETQRNVGVGLMGAGVAAAGVGVFLLLSSGGDETAAVSLVPDFAGGAAMTFERRF